MSIPTADFNALQKLLLERSGMALTSDKFYLVASRLSPVAQKLGLRGVLDLLTALRERPREDMIQAVVEAMVTHESLFFRDEKPFEQLIRAVLPDLIRGRPSHKPIRIWSAACSSGQEAYSIAMLLQEHAVELGGRTFEVLGTDISAPIVAKARAGVFSGFEVRRGINDARLKRHFRRADGDTYAVTDAVRRVVRFDTHNLLEPATRLGVFDIVYCRNVLIYFDAPTKSRVFDNLARQMSPDGALFLGSADTIVGFTSRFSAWPGERGLYRNQTELRRAS